MGQFSTRQLRGFTPKEGTKLVEEQAEVDQQWRVGELLVHEEEMVEEDADDRAKNNPRTNRELEVEDIRLGHEDEGQEQGDEDTATGEGGHME